MTARERNAQLISILEQRWGVGASTIDLLGGEFDETYRVTTNTGQMFCLKARPASESARLERAALSHLGSQGFSLAPSLIAGSADDRVEIDGTEHDVWLLDWIDGARWADLEWRGPDLCHSLGSHARQLAEALASFSHPEATRTHHWDLRRADESISLHRHEVDSPTRQAIIDRVLAGFGSIKAPLLESPTSVVHQDLNDHNVLATITDGAPTLSGIIDFGDMLEGATISELAIAVAYAMLREPHPVDAAAAVAAGWYGDESPSTDELAIVYWSAIARLVTNATTWAARSAEQPDYADQRSKHTWATIEQLDALPTEFILKRLRPATTHDEYADIARSTHGVCADASAIPLVDLDPQRQTFDDIDPTDHDAVRAVGLPAAPFATAHNAVRLDLSAPADGVGGPATVQLGVVLTLADQTTIHSPADATVEDAGTDRIVLAHELDGLKVWSHWTGFDPTFQPGEHIRATTPIGTAAADNPVHVQLLRFKPGVHEHLPTTVRPVDRTAWASLSVDPAPFLGLSDTSSKHRSAGTDVLAARDQFLASSQRSYYRNPPVLVRARGTWFVDENAHRYLDCLNNVTHVGHGNRRVVDAATAQMKRLNTNSRFVYDQIATYAERLASLLPDPLEVVFLVCTGSEANDLALRIARQVTGNEDILVIEGAYHGNTTAVTGISPNRYRGLGGDGPPATTHEVIQPNRYRGEYDYDDPDAGAHYAEDVSSVVHRLNSEGRPPAAFIAESLMGTAGQVVHPAGYLKEAFSVVRDAGGLCISDEVQVGFGRLGATFWGFEMGDVVPDIVTMGKPMGNGHPIAAVVTTGAIAEAFDQGMKYFNTFGGNPVSCAVANAVLDEIEALQLQQQSTEIGSYLRHQLEQLAEKHPVIGDVRGEGLYLGVEFVTDRATKEPAADFTMEVCEALLRHGVLMYPNGDLGNCLKIKPPMVFSTDDADRFAHLLDMVIGHLTGVRFS